ncbi:ubiquitin-protein transferase [Aureococcus anophagefferens]|nr:ubiquitin-protein transferase [Aureococcus anophagefferens]
MCDYSKWDKFTDADSDSDSESASLFSGLNRFVQSLGPKADGGAHPWEAPADVAQDRPLRFAVGDAVDVLVGDDQGRLATGGWRRRRGPVPRARVAPGARPYRVTLESGGDVACPRDDDSCVRARSATPPGPKPAPADLGGALAAGLSACDEATAFYSGALVAAAARAAAPRSTDVVATALFAALSPRGTRGGDAPFAGCLSGATRKKNRGPKVAVARRLLAYARADQDRAVGARGTARASRACSPPPAAASAATAPRLCATSCGATARRRTTPRRGLRGGRRRAAEDARGAVGGGADPDAAVPGKRLRCLHAAALQGHGSCVASLLESGAAVDVENAAGATPLCFALHHDHADAAARLLAAGADPLHDLARLSRRKRLEDAGATARAYVDHWVTAATRRARQRFDHGAVDDELARALEKAQSGTAKAAQLRFLLEEARATLAPIRDADAARPRKRRKKGAKAPAAEAAPEAAAPPRGARWRESDASSEGDAAPAPGSDDDAPAPPEADDDAAVVGLLRGLDLLRLLPRFRQHEIDGASLPYLTCDDDVQMGVPTGPRRRILCAVAAARDRRARRAAAASPLPVAARASWHCPISMDVMREPVVCACGNTFERSFIAAWLTTNDTSPVTGEVVPHKMLVPNHSMRSDIQEWHDECKRAGGAPPSPTRAAQQRRRDPEDA